MRKITLFIAMSLDGYIADCKGNVDWLAGESPDHDDMTSYYEFVKDIDTVIMGWNTYHQIVTDLSPGHWLYNGMTSYILTHRQPPDTDNIMFINENICSLVRRLREQDQGFNQKGIWICGGAKTIRPLIQEKLIDRFHLSIIPILLGNGIRLFPPTDTCIRLKLIRTESYNGITDLVYEQP